VRAILYGPGTDPTIRASALCTWDTTRLNFQCNIKTPRVLLTGTRNPYFIAAQETAPDGTAFIDAPGAGNPETVFFK
jgi:hypothetical protein